MANSNVLKLNQESKHSKYDVLLYLQQGPINTKVTAVSEYAFAPNNFISEKTFGNYIFEKNTPSSLLEPVNCCQSSVILDYGFAFILKESSNMNDNSSRKLGIYCGNNNEKLKIKFYNLDKYFKNTYLENNHIYLLKDNGLEKNEFAIIQEYNNYELEIKLILDINKFLFYERTLEHLVQNDLHYKLHVDKDKFYRLFEVNKTDLLNLGVESEKSFNEYKYLINNIDNSECLILANLKGKFCKMSKDARKLFDYNERII